MKRLATLSLVTVLFLGCTETQKFWEKEFVGVYAPGVQKEKDKARLGESLDFFLGKSKSERIRIIGPPNSCTPLTAGWETCEWLPKAVSVGAQQIAYSYDPNGIAGAWSYRGPLGQFTNADYLQGSSKPTSSAQAAQQPKKGWTHPTKRVDETSKEFAQDYFDCQNKLAHDPKAQSSMAMYVEYGIESCLREKGWANK